MPPAAMRKTVTVLFCDLVGSTELGERLDPERLRELLGRWYDAMREAVERHGGTVEKFIGDAVMAVFGVPHVHEDDALRAVRAAVEMRSAMSRLNEAPAPGGRPLEIRIGVNTGEVATGDGATTLVSGDAVNTASRLEQAAPPGEILIGPATRLLVENAVELEEVAAVAAKGKQRPVEAWRVLGTIPGATTFARRLDAPLVGRSRELTFLREQLAAVERERACRLVTVVGPAGIGKSRLAAELLAGGATVLAARCPPYGDGASLLPLEDLVRSAGGPEAVARAVAGQTDGDLIAARVCGAAGSAEELQWATRRMLETLAAERPVVVCVEDLHWAQPALLDLLEYVAGWTRDAPVLLLCLARPELLDLRPRWPGSTLTLTPLTETETQQLLDELSAEWPFADDARGRIVETAEGNPLFLEQLVAMLAEGGSASELPPTIQALLAARLDGLEQRERAVLERAAVVGRDFSRGVVTALSDGDDAAVLLSLVRKELLRPAPSAFAGEDGFRFRHALIRDAAYAAMPKRVRADLHERVAALLAERDADDEVVGYHLEQAHRYLVELGQHGDALARRSGELLGAAGLRAAARGDVPAARTLLGRSLALLPARHQLRIGLLRELSTALWLSGDVDAAELALSDSIDAARASGDTRLEWYGRLDRAARNASAQGETAALVATARRAVAVFEQLGDDLGLARAWRRLGLVAHTERQYAHAAAAFERAFRHAEASADEQERARTADGLCSALVSGPARVPDAVARVEAILAGVGANIVMRAHVSTSLAALVAMQGETERARLLLDDAGRTYDELGLTLPHIGWSEIVADVEVLAGSTAAAVAALRDGYGILDEGGLETYRGHYAALLALTLAGAGDREGAHAFARICEKVHATLDRVTLARLRAAQALLVAEAGAAESLAREAVALADSTDNLNLQATVRLVLARVSREAGAADAARALLEAKGNVAALASTGLWSLQT